MTLYQFWRIKYFYYHVIVVLLLQIVYGIKCLSYAPFICSKTDNGLNSLYASTKRHKLNTFRSKLKHILVLTKGNLPELLL